MAAREVPFAPGVIERLAAGVRLVVSGDTKIYDGWFGPGTPPVPVAPAGTEGRQLDYDVNVNTRYIPRLGERISFDTMRNVADGYDLMRMAIETKKDQLVQTRWTCCPKDKSKKADGRCDEINSFMECPDGINLWPQWFRANMEDLLVSDAWAILPRRTRKGDPYALELIDGTTIKPVVGLDGRRPTDGPVYQQVLKGVIVGNFLPGQLYYLPQNVRTHKIYGYGRVEQIITTVNIALNRQLYKLSYYTKGSLPDTILEGPPNATMEQLKVFRQWWNDLLSGNLEERRKAMVIPNGSQLHNLKEAALKDEYDDYLSRLICYAFSVSPSQLIKEQNRGKDETQQEAAKSEGTRPILDFVSKQLTRIICADLWKSDDLEIIPEEEKAIQPLIQAQIDDLDVHNGIRDINECRDGRGLQPLSPEELEARKPAPPPMAPGGGAPGEKPGGEKPPSIGAPPPKAGAKPPAAKLHKAMLSRRERPEMLKQETRVALGVSKRLHGLSKTIAPILVSAYGAIGKDDASQAKKIVNLITKAQFDALGGYLQDEGLDTYQKGVLAAAEQLSKDANDAMVNLANQKGIDWAIDHAGDLITDFEDATKNDLQGIVTQALQEGWSNDQLAEKISDSWSFSASRAEVIARTETAFADVQGNLALYREAGIEKLVWLAADTAPCDECEALDGKTISVDGEMPPAHPNCRCDVAPVIPEKED